MAIKDYSTTPDLNTQISGINIAEGCAPSGINNAIRQLMADMKAEKETKAAKDAEQDAAISAAQTAANNAASAASAAQTTASSASNSIAALAKVATSGSYNDLSDKPTIPASPADYIVETYRNGTEWYEVYKSGKVRQGGQAGGTSMSHGTKYTITLPKKMANTNYFTDFQPVTDIPTTACCQYTHIPKNGRQVDKLTYQHGSTSGGTGEVYWLWTIEGQGA